MVARRTAMEPSAEKIGSIYITGFRPYLSTSFPSIGLRRNSRNPPIPAVPARYLASG